jgi:hypothetical protein
MLGAQEVSKQLIRSPIGKGSLNELNIFGAEASNRNRDDARELIDENRQTGAWPMQPSDIQDYARQLVEAHGFKAIAEAAQKASAFEQQGHDQEAKTWRRIEAALIQMRGPHAS